MSSLDFKTFIFLTIDDLKTHVSKKDCYYSLRIDCNKDIDNEQFKEKYVNTYISSDGRTRFEVEKNVFLWIKSIALVNFKTVDVIVEKINKLFSPELKKFEMLTLIELKKFEKLPYIHGHEHLRRI